MVCGLNHIYRARRECVSFVVSMISLKSLRKIDPEMAQLSDEEVKEIREFFYAFGQLIFEDWCEQKYGSKNPVRLLYESKVDSKM